MLVGNKTDLGTSQVPEGMAEEVSDGLHSASDGLHSASDGLHPSFFPLLLTPFNLPPHPQWASSHNCIHLLSSARDSVGVTEAFSATVRKVLATPELLEKAAPGKGRVKLQPEGGGAEAGGACC